MSSEHCDGWAVDNRVLTKLIVADIYGLEYCNEDLIGLATT
jgi:hypothetical protein